ncbi:MAG TPA: Clp protease N-terminal domain-containing protein [Actinospica sp.]|nr:Clp protease N-terminal domain-containing protein [Actinospica sp.]
MTPTPNLQDLVQSVRDEIPDSDPLGQLSKAAEYSTGLTALGDRLLDHFVFQCRQAGMSWAELSGALGVSKQAAHKKFSHWSPNFNRFTDKAQQVAQGAIDAARRLGHDTVGTEHILLALFSPEDSLAALTLRRLEVRREAVLEQLFERRPGTPQETVGAIPFTVHAKTALRDALDEALDLNHNYIGTEHLLLGVYHDPAYGASEILDALGQSRETVRATLLEGLERIIRERAGR